MARLTRTQKYAQLSQEVANDKEQSMSTKQLADLEQRFKNITENLSAPKVEEVEEKVEEIFKPIEEFTEDFSVEETLQEENSVVEEPETKKYEWEDFDNSVVSDLESMLADLERAVEENKENETVVEETKEVVEVPQTEEVSIEEMVEEIPSFEDSLVEETLEQPSGSEEVNEPEVIEETFDDIVSEIENSVEEPIEDISVDDIETFEEYQDDKAEEEVIDNTIIEEEMTPEEIVEIPDTTLFTDNNVVNLLDEAIEDMDLHNKVNGQPDIDDIADSLVEEVRNESKEETVESEVVLDADEVVEYQDVPTVEEGNDDSFSNTVSLEITKIMEEIPSTPVVENPLVDVVEEPTIAVPVVEEVKEEENAVEIKNLNEIDIEPAASTVSSTIPFIVNANDDDEIEDDEDDEDEGSNTILNIILIILIIVLVIVLGLIIFYILKTKGII